MPEFVHELPEARVLFETLGADLNLLPLVIEKDYWVMHCPGRQPSNGSRSRI